ncbi:MAG TPA: hypothetical protein VM432_01165, partial [Bdellovibrionales bacterium]|nr:hypothetical protein [Bdellovibrionales bacterium]
MEAPAIRKVPTNYSILLMSCGWLFARLEYKVCLVVALLAGAISFVVNWVPYLGPIVGSVVGVLFGVGILEISRKIHAGEHPKVEDLFLAFKNDQPLLKRLAPVMIASFVVSLPNMVLPHVGAGIALIIALISLVVAAMVFFATPLIFYKNT